MAAAPVKPETEGGKWLAAYADTFVNYVNDALPTKMTTSFAKQKTKIWAIWAASTYDRASLGDTSQASPVYRVPMVWLRHGFLQKFAATVVVADDGFGVVQEVYRSTPHRCDGTDLGGVQLIDFKVGSVAVHLTITQTRRKSSVMGTDKILYDYKLTCDGVELRDEGVGGAGARPAGAVDPLEEMQLADRISIPSWREVPKYRDPATGLSQGHELAVEYEIRVSLSRAAGVGGSSLGLGMGAKPTDLRVDGPASCSNASFLAQSGRQVDTHSHPPRGERRGEERSGQRREGRGGG